MGWCVWVMVQCVAVSCRDNLVWFGVVWMGVVHDGDGAVQCGAVS